LATTFAGGCAHREATRTSAAPEPDPLAALRGENAALRRRVQILEDRVVRLETQGIDPELEAEAAPSGVDGDELGVRSLPDGRALPVVKLAPQGPPASRRDDGRRSASARDVEARTVPESRRGRPLRSVPDALAELDEAELAEPQLGLADDAAEVAEPSAARSYRLVGSRLVELTKAPRPELARSSARSRDRGKRGQNVDPVKVEYDAAMAMYKAGEVEAAERAFASIAARYPDHDYADNALYWKGEAAYDQEHYADALAAFTEVVERYGGGNKAPDALLKIGLCYQQLGDLPNARDVLTELVAAYPGERASD